MKQFDVEKAIKRAKEIPYSGRPEHKGLVLKDELIAVIEAGLVIEDSCAGDDTIKISRRVAADWCAPYFNHRIPLLMVDTELFYELEKALSSQGSKNI